LAYDVDPRLVRGFDYYTRTVFEITSRALGAQSAVCGGGRYDGLFESLGGPPTPAVGFGLGLERFLMVVKATRGDVAAERRGFQAVALGAPARTRLVPIVAALRMLTDAPTHMDFGERKLTAHFKTADRNGARYAIIVGDDELAAGQVVLRDLLTRADRRIPALAAPGDTARALVEATS
jgi:histidyl-tRNA synthetase